MNASPGRPSNRVHSFLSSSVFGLVVLLLIGCVSLLGMFIPQGAPPEQYVTKYGQFWANVLLGTGVANIYRVWWYLLLLFLAALNLVLCSLKRIRPSFRQAFSRPRAEDNEFLKSAPGTQVCRGGSDLSTDLSILLRKRRFSVDQSDHGSLSIIAAQKGGISRVGFLVTHFAVLLVLIAGAVTARTSYRHERAVSIGESFDVKEIDPSADFSVRVDDFVIETGAEGKIRDWKSTLTVLENGHDVLTQTIEVNHPLTYKGISFYQTSYGYEPRRVKEARLVFVKNDTASVMVDVPFQGKAEVPGTDLEVTVTDYVPDFVMDLSTGIVSSRSDEPRLPAVKLDVVRRGSVVDSGWLIMDMEIHSRERELARFHLADYYPQFYTGLDVVKNPGVSLLFTAFVIASAGIFISFLTTYRRIWIRIHEVEPGRSELRIAGASARHQSSLDREIDDLYAYAAGKATRATAATGAGSEP